MINYDKLICSAIEARKHSYSPYSSFSVGASVLTKQGEIFTGCNIENSAFGDTVCAERVAIFNAISQGKREFSAICIVAGKEEINDFVYPCGSCRQVLSEHCSADTDIVLYNGRDKRIIKLGELLPYSFKPEDLK